MAACFHTDTFHKHRGTDVHRENEEFRDLCRAVARGDSVAVSRFRRAVAPCLRTIIRRALRSERDFTRAPVGIRAAVEKALVKTDSGTLRATVSIGYSSCPNDATTVRDLVRLAEVALYAAKEAGKNRVESATSRAD